MRVFISWSGELSQELGEAIRDWLPCVLQYVKPYFTPNDVDKGARWNSEISRELDETSVGILCLTKNNLERPWLLFEAGALSKQLSKSYVCPILFGVENTDLTGPLVQFQTTPFSRSEIKKLVETINKRAGESSLEQSVVDSVFDTFWGQLDEKVSSILSKGSASKDAGDERTDRDILEELLELSRQNVIRRGPSRMPGKIAESVFKTYENLAMLLLFGTESEEEIRRILGRFEEAAHFAAREIGVMEKFNQMTQIHRPNLQEDKDDDEVPF